MPKGTGKEDEIRELLIAGKAPIDIVGMGYAKSTVYKIVSRLTKSPMRKLRVTVTLEAEIPDIVIQMLGQRLESAVKGAVIHENQTKPKG